MDLYYKVLKDSKTGKAITAILEKKEKFDEKARAVMDKYGIRCMYRIGWDLCGVYTCKFTLLPTEQTGRRLKTDGCRKVRSKNTELLADFKELRELSIKRVEVDSLLGIKDPFFQVGFEVFDDCIVFVSDDKHEIHRSDAKPISNTVYLRMQKERRKDESV